MFFNFVRPKIVVDAFTYAASIEKVAPIGLSAKFIPAWWKALPKSCPMVGSVVEGLTAPTMRTCTGVMELFPKGLVIPLWADLAVQSTDDGVCNWQWSGDFDPASTGITWHNRTQYGPAFDAYHQLKLTSPWYLSDKTGTNFMFINSFWNQLDMLNTFHVCHGVVNYKNQHETHINMIVDATRPINTIIPCGTPMVQLIPMTDREVIVKTHVLSREELVSRFPPTFRHTFHNAYAKNNKGETK